MGLENTVRFSDIHHAYFGQTQHPYLIMGIDFIDNAPYVLNKDYE